ncbi:binding-protein-dependent transport systems inner membrane component [Tistrella mobilis KA081020-065]|uniref:Binding-protein-dependent transport systems inner membrane component n=1 Tax=Tistrella mobilis (strain KA081020-065) TaxID=1110502 RepID=I3TQI6_TISMK|nr:binding-protein-dependent transport systems inner membrane component [Tistrella mobilis KA081020-065]
MGIVARLGFRPLGPLNRRRLRNFRRNRRGFWSFWIFLVLFVVSLGAEFVANDRPILVSYQGRLYAPVLFDYPDTEFGGFLPTPANYRDQITRETIDAEGWAIWPPIRFSYDTINFNLDRPAPAPPSAENWLGTDDQGRDVLARLIYGFRLSVLFGLGLTIASSVIGVIAGAIQGYFGGITDLIFQRLIEIWAGLPQLYVLLILSALFEPTVWLLLGLLTLFSWTGLVGLVRAEFLRTRNFDYVRAARADGGGGYRHHAPPYSAQCHGLDPHLPALHPVGRDHRADLARLPGAGSAGGLSLAG